MLLPSAYQAPREIPMKFRVEGMSCAHCERAITQALRAIDPAAQVTVDVAGGTVAFEGAINADQARAAIEDEGYTVIGDGAGTD